MTNIEKHIVILGGGPAGVGAASRLKCKTRLKVTLLEQQDHLGGNAGSFELEGIPVDYGSHRLHPACDPLVLQDIRRLLGDDLLDRPRHGRIRLHGRWIHFPLKPIDLGLRLPLSFSLGVASDSLKKILPRKKAAGDIESFASVMQAGLGSTITKDFYFPYAQKIWGYPPESLSAIQARRRVSAGSLGKMVRKVLNSIPGVKPPGSGRFFYPLHGFGEITEAYARDAQANGADILLHAKVTSIEPQESGQFLVWYDRDNRSETLIADQVWSTIPLPVLARSIKPGPPAELLRSTSSLDFRAMILIYLVLDVGRFSEYDAHYFPELDIPITRLSEPKNYHASSEPGNRTVLCAELPCSQQDGFWQMSDEQLGQVVLDSLEAAGIPTNAALIKVATRRLKNAYPIYLQGYETHFDKIDQWMEQQDGILTFGRQGLFAHDNTHHALFMAYSAVDCLDESGDFDHQKWIGYRKIFASHVVED